MRSQSNLVSTGVLSIFLMPTAFAAAVLATVLGVKVFDPWDQVSVLWAASAHPLEMLGHPHMPRYLVVYLGFLLEDQYQGLGFSIYIAAFVACNLMLLAVISRHLCGTSPTMLAYALFIAAHLMMNGRGAIAWTGWLLCIWVCVRIADRSAPPGAQIVWITISSLLAAVSTGVFVVVTVAYGFVMVRHWRGQGKQNPLGRLAAFAVGLPIAYVVADYFFVAVDKNVGFFGGGLEGTVAMLEHGLGVHVARFDLATVLLLGFLTIGGMVGARLVVARRWQLSTLDYLIVFAVTGGLFGFTVLTLAIPPVLLRVQQIRRAARLQTISIC